MNGPGKWERGVERDGADNKRSDQHWKAEAVRGCQRLSAEASDLYLAGFQQDRRGYKALRRWKMWMWWRWFWPEGSWSGRAGCRLPWALSGLWRRLVWFGLLVDALWHTQAPGCERTRGALCASKPLPRVRAHPQATAATERYLGVFSAVHRICRLLHNR